MREHDTPVDVTLMFAANQNKRPIRVLIYESGGWNLDHAQSMEEAHSLVEPARQAGQKWQIWNPNTDEMLP